MRQLLHHFVAKIPREENDEVGLLFIDPVGVNDRDVAPGQETPLLVRRKVGNEADQLVSPDAAIIEQSVALRRRTIAHDLGSSGALLEQEGQKVVADAFDPRLETLIDLAPAQPRMVLLGENVVDGRSARLAGILS